MKKEKTKKEALKYNIQRSEEGGGRLPKGIPPERESWTCVQQAQERVFLEGRAAWLVQVLLEVREDAH